MRILFFTWFIVLSCVSVLSAEPPATDFNVQAERKIQIDVILIEGLFRTQKRVVTRELEFNEGSVVSLEEIEQGIQRVRNMGLFRVVNYELLDQRIASDKQASLEVEHRIIRIKVDETWTLLPFWSFSQGGGALSFVAGIDDINLFGSFIGAGFQYQRFSGTNSFLAYLTDPRFLDSRVSLSGSVQQANQILYSYDETGARDDGWLRFRRSLEVGLSQSWSDDLRTGLGIGIAGDRYSNTLVPEKIADLEPGVPSPERLLAFSFSATLGRINKNKYLKSGVRYSQSLLLSEPSLGSTFRSIETSGTLVGYLTLPLKINIAGRLGAGIQSTENKNYSFALGGLGQVRGFFHRRFAGTKYWIANAEFRIPSFDNRYFVLQHIAFLDLAQTGFEDDSFFGMKAASTGLGFRLMIPKIYGLVVRFDYAFPLKGTGRSAISFGSQQFF